MRAAGNPGGEMRRRVGRELHCWWLGTTEEAVPTPADHETVTWYVAEDGVVYEASLHTEHRRFGKTTSVPALERPRSGRRGITELGPILFSIAERTGVEL